MNSALHAIFVIKYKVNENKELIFCLFFQILAQWDLIHCFKIYSSLFMYKMEEQASRKGDTPPRRKKERQWRETILNTNTSVTGHTLDLFNFDGTSAS